MIPPKKRSYPSPQSTHPHITLAPRGWQCLGSVRKTGEDNIADALSTMVYLTVVVQALNHTRLNVVADVQYKWRSRDSGTSFTSFLNTR